MDKFLKKHPLRKWSSEFLDFSQFKAPATLEKLQERLNINAEYFLANYFVICLLFALYSVFTSTLFAISLFAIGCIWVYLLILRTPFAEGLDLRQFGIAFRVKNKQLYLGLFVASFILLVATSGLVMLIPFLVGILHAALRKNSIKSRVSTFIDRARGNDISSGVEKVVMDEILAENSQTSVDIESDGAIRAEREQERQRYHTMRDHIAGKYHLK